MTVEEAHAFFKPVPAIARKLQTLLDVGLGYITLGQSGDHAVGRRGAARQARARAVQARHRPHALHPRRADHRPALRTTSTCCSRCCTGCATHGNTVVVIEHNLDVIKTADWMIDMGPEGGAGGGQVVAHGTPEDVAADPQSYTGRYLKPLLAA